MSRMVLHFRAEAYPMGSRALITPATAKILLEDDFAIHIESSTLRCFEDAEYEAAGARIVPASSWVTAPSDNIIIGIKQVELDTFPIRQTHIAAAHYYKQQEGWVEGLSRYAKGGGTLLDIGWIKSVTRMNFNTFEPHTGLAAAAFGVKLWLHQLKHPQGQDMEPLPPYRSADLLREAQDALKEGMRLSGRTPRAIVVGARGRTGTATVENLKSIGVPETNILPWGRKETSKTGADEEILRSDIIFNCTFIDGPVRPFVTKEFLGSERTLSTIVDVSCDSYGPHQPLPVYRGNTTPDKPSRAIQVPSGPPLAVFAIGYLPSLLPIEATERASEQFLPVFRTLQDWRRATVWRKLENLYHEKVQTLPKAVPRSNL